MSGRNNNMVSACVLIIVEGEGGKERKSLRLNVIIYEPPKKIQTAPRLHGSPYQGSLDHYAREAGQDLGETLCTYNKIPDFEDQPKTP